MPPRPISTLVPLTRACVTADQAGQWVCDVSDKPAHAGDVLWSHRGSDIDILEEAMPQAAAPVPPRRPRVPTSLPEEQDEEGTGREEEEVPLQAEGEKSAKISMPMRNHHGKPEYL